MPTSNERRALWFLAIVALSGSVVRVVRARSPAVPTAPDARLDRQLSRVDSARAKRGSPGRAKPQLDTAKPKVPDTPIDLDRATSAEIEGLPGIGPALAARIVAYRDSAGYFGSAQAFCNVKGVGPAVFRRVREGVVFSGRSASEEACEAGPPRTSKTHVTNRRKPL